MRARTCAIVALALAGGCTMDVGAGKIPPIPIQGRMDLPSAAARAGAATGTWQGADGEQLSVTSGDRTEVSASKELPFLSADDAAAFRDQLGGHLGAVQRIDIDVNQLMLADATRGTPMAAASTVDAVLLLEGVTLGRDGGSGRVSLPGTSRDRVMSQVAAGQEVRLTLGLTASCDPDHVGDVPSGVDLNVILQPILVIDELQAL